MSHRINLIKEGKFKNRQKARGYVSPFENFINTGIVLSHLRNTINF